MMKIGIISDSHNCRKNISRAVEIFNEQGVGYVLHAGDIASPDVAELFSGLDKAEFIAVFGNCDSDKPSLARTINRFGGEIYDDVYTGEIADKKIAIAHKPDSLQVAIDSGEYDLVIYGHTHKFDIYRTGNTLVVNPGVSDSRVLGKSGVVVLELDDMTTERILLK